MAKAGGEKQYNNFTKGLITEASALTFPENASLDEDNFVLERTGRRSRRLGIDYELGYNLIPTGVAAEILQGSRQSFHKWESPNGDTSISIGVVRIYNKLWFFNLLDTSPSTALLNGGSPLTVTGLANSFIETAVIGTRLVIVSEDMETPVQLSYTSSTGLVTSEVIPIQVRDIWGVVDSLPIDVRPTTLSQSHNYNLVNQGWSAKIVSTCGTASVDTIDTKASWVLYDPTVSYNPTDFWKSILTAGVNPGWVKTSSIATPSAPISIGAVECTKSILGKYPSNADLWTFGKVGDVAAANFEKYDPNILLKTSIYTTEAPKGSNIIDAFTRGATRRNLTGLDTLPNDVELGHLTTVASFASRAFYSGINSVVSGGDDKSPNYSGYIFFSQITQSKNELGKCFQEADPTSPTINDIVDTDGGTIRIPDVTRVLKLVATKSSLLVFAQNGVWEIFGDTGGFTATSFQVSKVSSVGSTSPKSIVEINGSVFYWARSGIFSLTQDAVSGRYSAQNVTIQTIQTFYNNLSEAARDNAIGFYDEQQNRVRWLYNDGADYSVNNFINKYNRELVLDLTLESFYPATIESLVSNSPAVCAYVEVPRYVSALGEDAVFVENDSVLDGVEQVVISAPQLTIRSSQFLFLTLVGTSFTFSKYSNTNFMDWFTADGIGVNYSSFLVTGYDVFGDVMRTKQVPYLIMLFDRTEDGFTQIGDSLEIDHPSSCLVQAQWNFATSAASGKWGTQFQAYRLKRSYIPSGDMDPFNYGESVVITKSKLRGKGRALSLYVQSESGKDMKLLGWGILIEGAIKP